ncbi:uncharacterized protein LOC112494569 [Cephus cinctus]|uniref:Uncharacterized protein LOC112494569 n=1 Tax=Cephus cinctus TaxID=211228 RepID=A0AAJ7RJY0_CEPCN|nr:uncharacterized protein LOC112494569 [Cephus cinctus]
MGLTINFELNQCDVKGHFREWEGAGGRYFVTGVSLTKDKPHRRPASRTKDYYEIIFARRACRWLPTRRWTRNGATVHGEIFIRTNRRLASITQRPMSDWIKSFQYAQCECCFIPIE